LTDISDAVTRIPARRLLAAALLAATALSQSTCRLDELLSPPPAGLLSISKDTIIESSAVGSTLPRTTSVNLANPGERQQSWIVTRARLSDWLEVEPVSGTAPSTVTLTLDPSGLSLGVHRDTLVFSSGSGALDPIRLPVEYSIIPCTVAPLNTDTIVADSLWPADCTAPHRSNSYAKLYQFEANAGDSVSLRMASPDFDAFLALDSVANGSSALLGEADECDGETGEPCLRYILLPETGSYFIEATTADGRETGEFSLEIRPPREPDSPTDLAQIRSDSITAVTIGATVSDTVFLFQGVVSDPDLGDSVRLQVEIQPVDSAYSGTPSGSSELGGRGDTLLLTVAGFADDTRYQWRARAQDHTGRGSSWVQFGENAEGESDFAVALQEVPESPIGLGQYRSDATTPISVGGSTAEPTVVISGEVNDPDPSDQIRLEVEVRPVGTTFTDVVTGSSVLVVPNSEALVTVTGLTDNTSYHWQARTIDQGGSASSWVSFGGNPETEADFSVTVPGGAGTPATPRQLRGDSTTAIPVGAVTEVATVVFSAVMDDPDPGDQVRLELELRSVTDGFTGLPNATSPLVPNGATAFIRLTGLNDDTDYHWRVRAVDAGGAVGQWVSGGGNADGAVDFRVAVPASVLVFTTPPGNTEAGSAIAPPVTVTAQEPSGTTDTSFVQDVTVAITPGSGGAGAVLSGTTTVQAVGGVATFSDLSLNLAAQGYSLTASTDGLSDAISSAFDVIAAGSNRLSLLVQPSTSARVAIPFDQQPVIQLVDANDNPVRQSGVDVTAEIESGPSGATIVSGSATTDAQGQAVFSGLAITGPIGGYTLRFTSTGLFDVPADPITLDLGDPDPGQTTAVVAGGQAGLVTTISIQARDPGGNDLTTSGGTLSVSINAGSPNADSAVTVTDNADGTYTATYAPTATGTDAFAITLNGDPIAGGPYSSQVVPGAASAAQTTATVPNGIAGEVTVIAIQARDDYGNDLTATGGNVTVSITAGPNVGGVVTVVDNGDGSYQASYTPTGAGSDALEIGLNGVVIGGGPYSSVVAPGDPSPAQTTATVPGGTAGDPTTIAIQGRDQFGNNLVSTGGTVSVSITSGPHFGTPVPVVDNNDGTYTASYTPTIVGTDNFLITLNGTLIGGGPYSSLVAPGVVSAVNSTASVPPGNAGNPTTVVVQAKDQFGNNLTTGGAVVELTITGANNPGLIAAADNLDGTYTATYTPTATGTDDIAITLDGTAISGSPYTSVVSSGGAVQLAFLIGPTDAQAGVPIADMQVAVQDADGNTVTSYNEDVVLAIATNPGGGTLSGTTTVEAASGVSTFSGLSIDKVGTGYTLTATSGTLTAATSAAFTITPGTATQLIFTQQPSNTVAAETVTPAVSVTVQDDYGNTVASYATVVSLAIGTNPGGGTLTGGDAVAPVAGVATFAGLSIDKSGPGYTLQAASDGLSQTSTAFDIAPSVATQLAFVVQPNNTLAGATIAPPVQIAVQDSLGNTVTSATDAITVAIGTNPAGGTLSGTLMANAVNGVAAFADLSIEVAGVGYTLTGSSGTLTQAVSAAFDIEVGTGNQLAFFVQPSNTVYGSVVTPAIQVEVQDAAGNRVTGATDQITLLIGTNPSGGFLTGTTAVAAVAGLATFSDITIDQSGVGYTLIALGSGLVSATSNAFDITPAATTTTITGTTPNPSTVGQGVVVGYSVTSTAGTPTGNVTVSDGVDDCTGTVAAGSCTIALTTTGARTLTADYAGAANYVTSQGTAAHQVNPVPTVTLAATPLAIAEAAGVSTLTATLSVVSGQDVTVNLGFTGTAVLTTDYTTSATSIVIPVGATTGTATVTAVQDALDEPNETVIVDIASVTNGTESGVQQQTITINDDDVVPTVALAANPLSITEAAGVSTLTATLSAVSGQDVTVTLGFSGTATNATDYAPSANNIVIPAGSASGTATVTAVQDVLDEPNETVIVDITAVTNATESGVQQQTVTITDDDAAPQVTLSAAPLSIAEAAGSSTVTATLSAVSGQNVTVNLGFTGTATNTTDYMTSANNISIPAGSTTGIMTVTAVQDVVDEANETVVVDITSVTNGTESGVQQQTVTITDDDAGPQVTLSAAPLAIAEAGGVSTVTATLSAISEQIVTVDLGFTGTATLTSDYTRSGTSIQIPAGSLTGTATVTAVQDVIDESNETVIVDITAVTNGTESGVQQQTITITDDDGVPTVTLTANPLSIGENGAVSTLTATLSATSGLPVTVTLGFTGTATLTDDYTRSGTSIQIPAGSLTGTATVTAVQDAIDEPNETVIVDITAVTNATESGVQQQTITINDDDAVPTVTLGAAPADIPEAGTQASTVTATLSAISGRNVTVNLGFSGTATFTSDYTRSGTSIVILAGSTTGSVSVTAVQDALDESNETVVVDITTVTNGSESGTQQATITITDDDPLPSLSIDNVTVTEGDTPTTTNAVFTVTLAPQSGRQVTVAYATANGTAMAPLDYTADSDVLTFPAGVTQQQISIEVLGDNTDEGDSETFNVNLSGQTNATIADAQGVGTITDDDGAPTITLTASPASIAEASGSSTVTAVLSATSGQEVTVALAFSGTATLTDDYTRSGTSISIPAGSLTGSITVVAVQDQIDEPNETVIVDIDNVTNATESGMQQQTVTIIDDDPPPDLSINDITVGEGNDPSSTNAVFTVSMSRESSQEVTVGYATSNGTATAGADYTQSSGNLTFPAGVMQQTVTVTVIGDDVDEGTSETFTVDLSGPINANITDAQGLGTITDDDATPTVTLTAAPASIAEGTASILTATLSGASSQLVTVTLGFGGDATLTDDYTRSATTIQIPALSLSSTATLNAVDDDIDEPDETVTVAVTNVTNAVESGEQQQTVTITDNDATPTVTLAASPASIGEGGITSTLTATLSGASSQTVTVTLGFGGTATLTDDYTRSGTSIQIPSLSLSSTATVTSVDDVIDEPDETVIVDITGVTNATEDGMQQQTVTITDDDNPLTITGVSPNTGPAGGGTEVTITGTGFTGATGVMFGGVAGADFTVVDDSTITVTTPAGTAGAVDVVVVHPGGDETLTGGFTYT
jgi:hypothetical protein